MRKLSLRHWLPALLLGASTAAIAQPTWQVQSDYFGERNAIAQPRTIRAVALTHDGASIYTGLIQSPNTGSTSLRKVSASVLAIPGTDHVIFGNGMPGGGCCGFNQVGGQPVYADQNGAPSKFEAWRDVDNSPEGIDADDRGLVYVALQSGITGANRVDIFTSNLATQVGAIGVPAPTGVHIYKTGSTYYAYIISQAGLQRWNVTAPGTPFLDVSYNPGVAGRSLTVDADGTAFVVGTGTNQVTRISPAGAVTHATTFTDAAGVAVFYNKLYIIKRQSPTQPIVVLNKADLTSAGPDLVTPAFGASRGSISQFTSIDVNAQGRLYVSEENYTGALTGGNAGALTTYTPPATSFNPAPGPITGRIYFDRVLISSPVEPAFTNAQVTATTDAGCSGGNNGSATVSFTEGFPPYSYSLNGGPDQSVAGSPFTISGLSAGSYTVVVKDGGGNSSSASFTIGTAQDVTPPSAQCKAATVYLDASGTASVTAADIDDGSFDNCGPVTTSLICGSMNFIANGGFNTGTSGWTFSNIDFNGGWRSTGGNPGGYFIINDAGAAATDPEIRQTLSGLVVGQTYTISGDRRNVYACCGNPTALSFGVVVDGNVILQLPNAGTSWTPFSVSFTATGTTHVISFTAERNGDDTEYGIDNISVTGPSGCSSIAYSCSDKGPHNVTMNVVDGSGNSATCTAVVTVADNLPPTAQCKAATVTLVNGTASVTPADVNDGSFDNCGGVNGVSLVSVSPNTFDCSDIGPNTVTLTVMDAGGLTATCNATVTVAGNSTACTITSTPTAGTFTENTSRQIYLGYGDGQTVLTANATGGTTTGYQWTGPDLSCYTCQSPVFSPTAGGTYTFTVQVTNNSGCTSTCTITICVLDIRVPGQNNKVYICHLPNGDPSKANTLSVSVNAVAAHLAHSGDRLGQCSQTCGSAGARMAAPAVEKVTADEVNVYPNPNNGTFIVELPYIEDEATVSVTDVAGKTLQHRVIRDGDGNKLRFSLGDAARGMYFVEVSYGDQRFRTKLIIQ